MLLIEKVPNGIFGGAMSQRGLTIEILHISKTSKSCYFCYFTQAIEILYIIMGITCY